MPVKNKERIILGVGKIDEGRRVYFPDSVIETLELEKGNKIVFRESKASLEISKDERGATRIGHNQRVWVPKSVMKRLGLNLGDQVLFLKEEGTRVTLSRVVDRIK